MAEVRVTTRAMFPAVRVRPPPSSPSPPAAHLVATNLPRPGLPRWGLPTANTASIGNSGNLAQGRTRGGGGNHSRTIPRAAVLFREGFLSDDMISTTLAHEYQKDSFNDDNMRELRGYLKQILNNNDEHLEYYVILSLLFGARLYRLI